VPRRYTEQQFRAAIDDPDVRTMADLCRALGIVPRGGNYETLRAYAAGSVSTSPDGSAPTAVAPLAGPTFPMRPRSARSSHGTPAWRG
jgi:hypothetical protein